MPKRYYKIEGLEPQMAAPEQPSRVFQPRDPRFDPRVAGSSDVRHFHRNYSFLDDLRRQELTELEKALKKEKDAEKKAKIKMTIQRTKNKMVENSNKTKKLDLIDEMKSEIKKASTSDDAPKGSKGKKYNNLKKSDIKMNLLVNKYKELKATGKLNKYMERKRKKLIKRDEKSLVG